MPATKVDEDPLGVFSLRDTRLLCLPGAQEVVVPPLGFILNRDCRTPFPFLLVRPFSTNSCWYVSSFFHSIFLLFSFSLARPFFPIWVDTSLLFPPNTCMHPTPLSKRAPCRCV